MLRLKLTWVFAIVIALGTVAGGIVEGHPVLGFAYAGLMVAAMMYWWRLRTAVAPDVLAKTDQLGILIVMLSLFGAAAPRLDALEAWVWSRWC
jgi:hypothetical protein